MCFALPLNGNPNISGLRLVDAPAQRQHRRGLPTCTTVSLTQTLPGFRSHSTHGQTTQDWWVYAIVVATQTCKESGTQVECCYSSNTHGLPRATGCSPFLCGSRWGASLTSGTVGQQIVSWEQIHSHNTTPNGVSQSCLHFTVGQNSTLVISLKCIR